MTDLSADYKALANYRPSHKVRFVTAASLFVGHDAAINIMRIIMGMGVEVIHLGHNRSVEEVVTAALQEDALGAIAAYMLNTPTLATPRPVPLLILAGLLVGFGTVLGSGCTSGHGVCGMGRRSVRSLVATLVFMGAGIATVFIAHLANNTPAGG